MNNWWTEEDAAAFKAKTDILVKQFGCDRGTARQGGQPALFANGALCLGENIADQGGLRVAYTAYHNSLEGKGEARTDRRLHPRTTLLSGLRTTLGAEHPRRGDRIVSPSSTYTRWASGG